MAFIHRSKLLLSSRPPRPPLLIPLRCLGNAACRKVLEMPLGVSAGGLSRGWSAERCLADGAEGKAEFSGTVGGTQGRSEGRGETPGWLVLGGADTEGEAWPTAEAASV